MFNETTGLGADQSIVQPTAGAGEYGGSNAGPGGKTPGPDTLFFQCAPEYIAKYRVKYGQAPAFCGKPIPPEATGMIDPTRQARPIPAYILPPRAVAPAPESRPYAPTPITTVTAPEPVQSFPACPPGQQMVGMTSSIPRRAICQPAMPSPVQPTPGAIPPATVTPTVPARRPRPRRITARPQPAADGTCPHVGWVSRPLPGTQEYGVFPCTPGRPVRIDPARMASLTAGARARGLSDMDEIFSFVQQEVVGLPMWAWLAIAAAIFFFLKRR